MARFEKGKSGNPAGRPRGIKDSRVSLREKLLPHADDLIQMVVKYSLAGDMTAMRIVMERIMPPIKEEHVHVSIPKIEGPDSCIKAHAAVLDAVAAGEMLPSEAQLMSSLIDAQRRAYETHDLAKRLEAIEESIRQQGKRL